MATTEALIKIRQVEALRAAYFRLSCEEDIEILITMFYGCRSAACGWRELRKKFHTTDLEGHGVAQGYSALQLLIPNSCCEVATAVGTLGPHSEAMVQWASEQRDATETFKQVVKRFQEFVIMLKQFSLDLPDGDALIEVCTCERSFLQYLDDRVIKLQGD